MGISALVLLAALAGPTLSLEDAVRTAQAHHPQLQQARAATDVADARADESMAPMLPQVSGNASYQRSTSNFAPKPGALPSGTNAATSNSFNTNNYYNFGVNATQLVYDFGQTANRWRASQASADAQRQNELVAQLQVVLNARAAFFAARAQKELVRVAEQTVANQQRHLQQIQGFVEVKTRPEIDLAQARLDMANAELLLVNAQNGYATSRAQLNQAMGVVRDADYDVADETMPSIAGEDGSTDALAQEAYHRPDIVALQKQIRAQELSLRATRGA